MGSYFRWRGAGLACALALVGASTPAWTAELDPRHSASWQLPDPDLYEVDVVGDMAWAVGYWGAVLVSEDGGESWSPASTPVDETLFSVSFADARHGWAVGDGGVILRSTDGGRSWTRQEPVVTDTFGEEAALRSDLFDVVAVSSDTAWVVGDFGVVLRTTDGRTWEQIRIPEEDLADENLPDRIYNGVDFTDPEHGWVAGEFGTVLRTTDGGETWVGERTFEGVPNPELYLFDVDAADGAALSAGVGGSLITTEDRGRTWSNADPPTTAGLFSVASCGDRAIAAGDRGVLLVREGADGSWRSPERPRLFNWLAGSACEGELAFAVGQNGLILRSVDGGERWVQQFGREPPPLEGVSVPDPGKSTEPTHEHLPESRER